MLKCQSILGIKESRNSISKIAKKIVKLLFGIEPISLIQSGIIVANVFEDLLIKVMAERRNHIDHSTDNRQRFKQFPHMLSKQNVPSIS